METFSALLALCAGNSPVIGEFPTQRPVTRCFVAFFDLCLNKRLSEAGDLRHHHTHYEVTVLFTSGLLCQHIHGSGLSVEPIAPGRFVSLVKMPPYECQWIVLMINQHLFG